MVTFKDYLLEYASKEKAKFFGISKMKSGSNGKDWNNPHGRKHANTIAKTYNHKHPIVDRVVQGMTNNVHIAGPMLDQILNLYDTDFDIGTKSLGNSVEITMSTDNKGNRRAIITRKVQQNGL